MSAPTTSVPPQPAPILAPAPVSASARDWIAVASTMLGAFMAILDIQITNASLANIEGSLGTSSAEGSWISTSYLVAEIIVIPLTGWLASVIGLKRYLMANCVLFLLFSVCCGLSDSLAELIAARAGQGFCGGVLIPTAITVLRTRLPRHQQPIGIALFGFTATFAPSIGPTLGGWLTDLLSWHYVFYINLLPGAAALAMLSVALDPARARWGELTSGDWPGIGLMAVGLSSLTVVLEEGQRWGWFGSELIRLLAAAAVLGCAGFVLRELSARRPFIDLRVLAQPGIAASCVLVTILGGVALGSIYLLPLYCAQVQNYDPMQIGWVVMWVGLPQLAIYPVMPMLMRRVDLRLLIVVGTLVYVASCWLNTRLSADVGMTELVLPQLLRGIGQPLFMVPLSQLATANLSPAQLPHAAALSSMLRNLGGSVCIATVSTVIERREQFHFSAIAGGVTRDALATQDRVARLTRAGRGVAGPVLAHRHALATIAGQVRLQASILSFCDAFLVIAVGLVCCLALVPLLRRPGRAALVRQ